MVTIEKNAVVMMGAVINIGAVIGEGTMVDMNAVVGARGILGKNVHLGACSVVAGVLEPPSATPVIVEDDVLIGANCVILEGVRIGKSAAIVDAVDKAKDGDTSELDRIINDVQNKNISNDKGGR